MKNGMMSTVAQTYPMGVPYTMPCGIQYGNCTNNFGRINPGGYNTQQTIEEINQQNKQQEIISCLTYLAANVDPNRLSGMSVSNLLDYYIKGGK